MVWSGRHEREEHSDEDRGQKSSEDQQEDVVDRDQQEDVVDRPESMPTQTSITISEEKSKSNMEDRTRGSHRLSTAVGKRMSTMADVSKKTLHKLNSTVTGAIDSYNGEEWTWVDTKRYLVVSTLICMVILHPTLTRQSLFLFMCVPINERIVIPGIDTTPLIQSLSFLRKDVQLECYTEQHWTYAILLGLPGVICYVIGTPVVTFYVLYQRKHKLTIKGPAGDECRKTYGFIYRGYSIYYWEVVIMSRKISMVIVAVFGLRASVQTQALMSLFVVLMAGAAHIYAKPFDVPILDRLELYSLVTAFVTLYFGMFFFTSDVEESPFFLAIITIVIMSTNFAFILYWSIAVYHALCEEVVFFARFHVSVSICYHRCTHKCCRSCRCTKRYKTCIKKWRKHHSNKRKATDSDFIDDSSSDSDSDSDSDSEVQVRRRTKDHTVWASMAGDGVERENLDSIHKRRKKQLHGRRKSGKRALEMVTVRRRDSYTQAKSKLDNDTHSSELEAQIRANKAASIFHLLGVTHHDSTKNLKMLPAPNFPAPETVPGVPLPPPLPGPPGRFQTNPVVQSRWKNAMKTLNKKQNQNQKKRKGRQHKIKQDNKPATLELIEINKTSPPGNDSKETVELANALGVPPGNLQSNPMKVKAGEERKEHLHESPVELSLSSSSSSSSSSPSPSPRLAKKSGASHWASARANIRGLTLFSQQSTRPEELKKTPSMSKMQVKRKSREERLAMMRTSRKSSIGEIYEASSPASRDSSDDTADQIHINPLLQGRSDFNERMSRHVRQQKQQEKGHDGEYKKDDNKKKEKEIR